MEKRSNKTCAIIIILLCVFTGMICFICANWSGVSGFVSKEKLKVPDAEKENSSVEEKKEELGESDKKLQNMYGEDDAEVLEKDSIIQPEGKILKKRIAVPKGYRRTKEKAGSLGSFLRDYPMKKDGSPVLLYDGSRKGNQSAHAAVFRLPIEAEDLQQCADSVMRVYAEYFWKTGQKERIRFHFVDGFLADYVKWRDGGRIQVGNTTSWSNSASYDASYENFKKFMRIVFAYAGTLSMESESKEISIEKLRIGDIFIKGASPGHVVMVVDVCKNAEGKKAFLLGQGYMPAQEFHLLKNPEHEEDPWYYEEEVTYPFQTPEYTFEEGSLRRLKY